MGIKISVVMAVYNGERFIEQQLKSIIEQDIPPTEIIIVEDASIVSSKAIVEKYKKICLSIDIVYFEHPINQGYARTFFEALQYARGDYIFFSDQDDIWNKNKIKEMTGEFLKNKRIQCLSCKNIIIDGSGKIIGHEKINKGIRIRQVRMKNFLRQSDLRPGMCLAITKYLRKKVLALDYHSFKSHDRYIEFMACMENGFFILNEYLNYYRIHDKNTSGMNLTGKLRDDIAGRIRQADLEIEFYENLIKIIGGRDSLVEDICDIYMEFHTKRKKLLKDNNLFIYLISMMPEIYKFTKMRIMLGDILSIIKSRYSIKKES